MDARVTAEPLHALVGVADEGVLLNIILANDELRYQLNTCIMNSNSGYVTSRTDLYAHPVRILRYFDDPRGAVDVHQRRRQFVELFRAHGPSLSVCVQVE